MTPRVPALRTVALAAGAVSAIGATGCASNVKGSWACAAERGGVCASITDIDHAQGRSVSARRDRRAEPDPILDGAIPARLIGEGGWTAGAIAGAPVREGDPTMRVAIAPWIDAPGDYHAASEVYAVMRRGHWYARPPTSMRRIELAGAPEALRPATAAPIADSGAPPAAARPDATHQDTVRRAAAPGAR